MKMHKPDEDFRLLFIIKKLYTVIQESVLYAQMRKNGMDKEKVFAMKLSKVYPLLIEKAERKGRTKEEVDEVTCWLTGYTRDQLKQQLEKEVDYRTFFEQAPAMSANCHLITGSICGIKVQEIEDPLMQKIRYLDKLVDELAKGKAMEKILR